jgi:hypothetical protein
LDPAIAYDGTLVIGRYYTLVKGVLIRPDVTGVVEGSHVADRGTSKELEDASDFLGVGGDVRGRIRLLPLDPRFTNFLVDIGWKYRNFFIGDLQNENLSRFIFNIAYVFPYLENVTLNFGYENGDNLETYQDEEYYKIALGLKF